MPRRLGLVLLLAAVAVTPAGARGRVAYVVAAGQGGFTLFALDSAWQPVARRDVTDFAQELSICPGARLVAARLVITDGNELIRAAVAWYSLPSLRPVDRQRLGADLTSLRCVAGDGTVHVLRSGVRSQRGYVSRLVAARPHRRARVLWEADGTGKLAAGVAWLARDRSVDERDVGTGRLLRRVRLPHLPPLASVSQLALSGDGRWAAAWWGPGLLVAGPRNMREVSRPPGGLFAWAGSGQLVDALSDRGFFVFHPPRVRGVWRKVSVGGEPFLTTRHTLVSAVAAPGVLVTSLDGRHSSIRGPTTLGDVGSIGALPGLGTAYSLGG
ncbi:MAG: hypothetical protein JWM71_2594 [Solirubrobacteraceae bacterium]|nr:hypothetical protein [Solirubrobacteraceae bacterium]